MAGQLTTQVELATDPEKTPRPGQPPRPTLLDIALVAGGDPGKTIRKRIQDATKKDKGKKADKGK
jgi:hypothetical protein